MKACVLGCSNVDCVVSVWVCVCGSVRNGALRVCICVFVRMCVCVCVLIGALRAAAPRARVQVFNLFDDDHTGKITLRNLKRVAKELGETMTGAPPSPRAAHAPCVCVCVL
jgi:hypothetical protein